MVDDKQALSKGLDDDISADMTCVKTCLLTVTTDCYFSIIHLYAK